MKDALNQLSFCIQRYHLSLQAPNSNLKYPKAYLNHMLSWRRPGLTQRHQSRRGGNKIVLHSTSAKVCAHPELYGCLNLALSCCGSQTPQAVKSRKSVAAFKVMAGTLVGGRSVLRKATLQAFRYKWTFLSASEDLRGPAKTRSIGSGFFVFELGLLDYKAFEPLPGLYIQFDHPQQH
jgi:hypothetical protein